VIGASEDRGERPVRGEVGERHEREWDRSSAALRWVGFVQREDSCDAPNNSGVERPGPAIRCRAASVPESLLLVGRPGGRFPDRVGLVLSVDRIDQFIGNKRRRGCLLPAAVLVTTRWAGCDGWV
jgi:hypothetical protein